jgi:hypothetical protein
MRRIATVALALPMLLAPAVAVAAKKKPVVPATPGTPVSAAQQTVQVNGPAGTTGTATATCPKGTQVLSGGWNQIGGTNASAIEVYQSVRSGKRAWRVSGIMVGSAPAPKITLIGYAYCRAQAPLVQRSVTTPIPLINNDFNGATVTTKCPKGMAVVSGGFSIPQPTTTTAGFVHQSSRQSGRVWSATASIATVDGTPSQSLTAVAYCSRTTVYSLRKNTVPGPPTTTATFPVSVNSPKCKPMASGGFRAPSTFTGNTATSLVPIITENRRLGKSGPWRAGTIYPGTATDTTTLTSSGYCG